MNVEIDEYLARVRQEAPAAPRDTLVLAMIDTIRDFCRWTRALQHEVFDELIQANVSDYDVLLPNNDVEVVAIERMELNGTDIIFKDHAWLNRYVTNWRLREADDFRYYTHMTGPGQYTFPCVPLTQQSGLYYRVSLQPTVVATTVDEGFLADWLEDISKGAKAQLLAMSGKLWTDKKRASDLDKEYRTARGLARIQVNNSHGNAEQRWQNPRGFA